MVSNIVNNCKSPIKTAKNRPGQGVPQNRPQNTPILDTHLDTFEVPQKGRVLVDTGGQVGFYKTNLTPYLHSGHNPREGGSRGEGSSHDRNGL